MTLGTLGSAQFNTGLNSVTLIIRPEYCSTVAISPLTLSSIYSLQQKSDDTEYQIDEEIISKEETSYREKKKNRSAGKGNRVALVPTQSGLEILKPSFVMDQANKNQTWLYDTPGIISENQV